MGTFNSKTKSRMFHQHGLPTLVTGLFLSGLSSAATITVTNSTDTIIDNSSCSLREAIINANNNDQSGSTDCAAGEASTDVIVFDAATNNVPIVLTRTGSDNAAQFGDLDITDDVIISGNGADSVTEIDGNATDRVFEIRNGASVQMLEIAVTNGGNVSTGAGIRVFDGSLTMQDAGVFSNNISVNAATNSGTGAGISANGNVSLTRVSVLGNDIDAADTRSGQGAGIYVGTGGRVSLVTSLVKDNTITTEGGTASGAGLYNIPSSGVTTNISSTLFSGNQAINNGNGNASGGAINHQSGNLGILRGMFRNNLARTTDSGVVASGGAIAAFAPITQLRNSTFSGNLADGVDAAWGGAISLNDSATLNNVTITLNQVQTSAGGTSNGGGIRRSSGTLTLSNTVVAGNTSSGNGPDCSGDVTSAGYNLIGNNSGCGFVEFMAEIVGDVAGGGSAIDPQLAALADNGGAITIDGTSVPVLTHAPRAGSPVIDAADPNEPGSGGTCETLDQPGNSRPIDGDEDGGAVCDIGAVEFTVESTASLGGGSSGGGGGGSASPVALLIAALAFAIRLR
ncbi:MAG: choice-of-anchor Q domain-containing protein, partial [Reinekea sp.]|nr:choice-of-anchor Q domain-containing protein [Reinekea sp.]